MSEENDCKCDMEQYHLTATGYILCLGCGKQTKKQDNGEQNGMEKKNASVR